MSSGISVGSGLKERLLADMRFFFRKGLVKVSWSLLAFTGPIPGQRLNESTSASIIAFIVYKEENL